VPMQAPMDSRDPAGELALTGLTLRRQLSLAEQVEVAGRAGMSVPQFMRYVEALRRRGLLRVTTAFDAETGLPLLEFDLGPALGPPVVATDGIEEGGDDA